MRIDVELVAAVHSVQKVTHAWPQLGPQIHVREPEERPG